jgi:ribosomal protein L13
MTTGKLAILANAVEDILCRKATDVVKAQSIKKMLPKWHRFDIEVMKKLVVKMDERSILTALEKKETKEAPANFTSSGRVDRDGKAYTI